jgi:exonuclease VII large subunit
MDNKSIFDVVSFIASIAALLLAIIAIWLSIVFYRMSNEATKATTEAAKGISASVERLEKLFDKLYSDTFSMMRDTVSDMRKHIWPVDDNEQEKVVEEAEKKTDERISEVRKAIESQVSEMLQRQKITDDKMKSLQGEMRVLIDRAIVRSREAESEAREETIREHILRAIRVLMRSKRVVTISDIIEKAGGIFSTQRIVSEIERMRVDSLIRTSSDMLGPATEVRILGQRPIRTEPDIE